MAETHGSLIAFEKVKNMIEPYKTLKDFFLSITGDTADE
jgi:hypothetical protein